MFEVVFNTAKIIVSVNYYCFFCTLLVIEYYREMYQKKNKKTRLKFPIEINENQWQSMKINENKKSLSIAALIFDFQYQSIDYYWFISINWLYWLLILIDWNRRKY